MKDLFEICCSLMGDKCFVNKNTIICNNNNINVIEEDNLLARVRVNFCYVEIGKTVWQRKYKLKPVIKLPRMEITIMKDEAEIIGVWLAMAMLGVESPQPVDLLCWPSGDYAWTFRAAEVGKPARMFE